jgi:hypothetical protein
MQCLTNHWVNSHTGEVLPNHEVEYLIAMYANLYNQGDEEHFRRKLANEGWVAPPPEAHPSFQA